MSINRRLRTNYTTKKKYKKKKKNGFWILKFLLISFMFFSLFSLFAIFLLYSKYIADLPSIKELENMEIAEASTIYDRNGNELYKVFKEKRTYKNFDSISPNMINAIVSWEDKRFFTNPWYDMIWLLRAVLYKVTWKSDWIRWTSTITQQLIRNTIIENRSSLESLDTAIWRKIKEIYLAYKLTNGVSKEKILELYLNKISFWSNSFWIEQAAATFFWKKAKDLTIYESSILASLPKWPTYYSPYNHPDRVVWYPYVYNKENEEEITQLLTKKTISLNSSLLKELTNFLTNLKWKRLSSEKIVICSLDSEFFKNNLSIDDDGCSVIDYSKLLDFLNWIRIEKDWEFIEYQTWRKDFILWRMLEDNYITFEQYKEAIIKWFWYKFQEVRNNIKYPHFVFYVKEYLENKYWKDIVEEWGLRIYTSLDNTIQDKAEELVLKYSEINKWKFGADNAALIALDNENGWILAMVWWRDYFDKESKWNVNIITSKLQPWSTFKPFVYSLWLIQENIWTKSPIYDLKTTFPWNYIPSNFDWKFMWKMNVSTALNNSRNIPAIKMYYLAWWEKKIVDFMRKLWVKSLNDKWLYWAPLALWTGEMTPLELARAYTVFANMWKLVDVSPILKIVDSKWIVIEDRTKNNSEAKQVITPEQSYLITSILTNTETRPKFWNKYLSLNWRKVAAKTWTSTKQYKKWWKKYIFPSNLWTVWYTPQVTTVVWAWNTDWRELNNKWNWLEWAWPIWKDFMEFVHKWKDVKNWNRPNWVKEISISSISWLLTPEWFNSDFIVSSLFKNVPIKFDDSLKEINVDLLCNWKVTENTPSEAIWSKTLIRLHSIRPEDPAWENPVLAWMNKKDDEDESKKALFSFPNIVTSISEEVCERTWAENSDIVIKSTIKSWDTFSIWTNYIQLAYKSTNPIQKILVFLWNESVYEIKVSNKTKWTYEWSIIIPRTYSPGEYDLVLKAIDNNYYAWSDVKKVNLVSKDTIPPKIEITNPLDKDIKLYEWDSFNLRWNVVENTFVKNINIYLDDKPLKMWLTDKDFVFMINEDWNLAVWSYTIKVEAIDSNFNIWTEKINLEILQK